MDRRVVTRARPGLVIQRIAHERVLFAPIWTLAFLNGVGAPVEEARLGLIQRRPHASPSLEAR